MSKNTEDHVISIHFIWCIFGNLDVISVGKNMYPDWWYN